VLIVPAIDLSEGRPVRLREGVRDTSRVVADDPVAVARSFEAAGAQRIHVVDLDGAFEGASKNGETIRAIASAVGVEVEVGGGLRSAEAVELLFGTGVRYAMIGTMVVKAPDDFAALCRAWPGRIIAGIDGRDGLVRTDGWVGQTDRTVLGVARFAQDAGACAVITTDIARDGTGLGVNVESTSAVAEALSIPVLASGGVRSRSDIEALAGTKVAGVVVGRALYDGDLELEEALRIAGTQSL
jgi:phosphoribosylformimino-5-aminoimidazole carboxamide ribotide isomerase